MVRVHAKKLMFVLMNLLLLIITSLVVPVLSVCKENANITTDCLNEEVQLKVVPRSIILNDDHKRDVLTFKCVMVKHNRSPLPAKEIFWTKNNNAVLHTENVTKVHTDGNMLWISNPDDEDIGFYKCIQKSNLSSYAIGIIYRRRSQSHHYEKAILRRNIRSSTSQSNDTVPPVAVGSSKDQTGIIGEIGNIHANITGVYSKIVWKKNNFYLIEWPYRNNMTADLKYNAFENGTLWIRRLDVFHNGTFEAAVTNATGTSYYYPEITVRFPSKSVKQTDVKNCGKYILCLDCKTIQKRSYRSRRDLSQSFLSDPLSQPWFQPPIVKTAPPKCVKLWVGQTLELKCDFVGFPNVLLRWEQSSGGHRFNNKMAASNGRIRMEYGDNNPRLIIKNIQKKDQNTYHCVGQNYFGTVVLYTQVKVIDYTEFCGSPYKHYQNRFKRVTGGGVTTPIEWPWQAWLTYDASVLPSNIYCGGVVVNSRWVMTAYHCILQYNSLKKLSPKDLVLRVGVWNTSLTNEKSRQSFRVKKIHVPENVFNIDKDMVLLELKNPIFFSKSVRPICIGTVVPNPETNCEVSGYGLTGLESPSSEVLKKVTVPLVHAYECRRFYSYLPIPINAICAGLPFGGGGSCLGDSGGPLVCKREGKNQYDLIGLVSGGKGCGHGYTYFSNVVDNRQWIIETAELATLVND